MRQQYSVRLVLLAAVDTVLAFPVSTNAEQRGQWAADLSSPSIAVRHAAVAKLLQVPDAERTPAERDALVSALNDAVERRMAGRVAANDHAESEAESDYLGDLVQAVARTPDKRLVTPLVKIVSKGAMVEHALAIQGADALGPIMETAGQPDAFRQSAALRVLTLMVRLRTVSDAARPRITQVVRGVLEDPDAELLPLVAAVEYAGTSGDAELSRMLHDLSALPAWRRLNAGNRETLQSRVRAVK